MDYLFFSGMMMGLSFDEFASISIVFDAASMASMTGARICGVHRMEYTSCTLMLVS